MLALGLRRIAGPGAGGAAGSRGGRVALAAIAAPLLVAALPGAASAAPAWLAPTRISALGARPDGPQVAVDAAGETVAVWPSFEGSSSIIQAAARPAGGAWSAPVGLSAPGQRAEEAQVALDPAGDAVAMWERDDGADYRIEAAVRPAGGAWGTPLKLSAPGHNGAHPQVAVDAAGEAVAVWEYDGFVEGATMAPGGTWTAPVELSGPELVAERPQVAVDPAGDAVAVWEREEEGGGGEIQAAVRPAGGAWAAPVKVSTEPESRYPQVAVDAAGEAVAVWERDGADREVEAAVKPAGGGWGSPVEVSAAGHDASEPQVAVDATGDAVAVWEREEEGGYGVQAAARPAGGAWRQPADVSAAESMEAVPQVAVGAGEAAVVWETDDEGEYGILAATAPVGGGWGAPVGLSTAGQDGYLPAVVSDPEGDAVAVWSEDGSGGIVQAAAHDAAGPRLGGLAIPATGTAGAPLSFSVSPFDVWSALGATGWSFGDGGSATGASVEHTYASPGTYAVAVTGTDALGNATTATGTVTIAPPPGPLVLVPRRAIPARAARVVEVKGRTALLALTCGAGGSGCAGSARLFVPAEGRKRAGSKKHGAGGRAAARASSRQRRRPTTLGKARFSVPAGAHRTVKVPLTRRARALLAAAGRKGLAARLGGTGLLGRAVVLKAVGHRRRH